MTDSFDRRTFLSRGAMLGGATLLGGSAASILAACGSNGTSGGSSVQSNSSGISSSSPKPGGSLTFAVESEVNGFDPSKGRFDPGGIIYARAVFDPLTAYTADGTVKPYLAQSIKPNASYTAWTITLRPNITFHDGTPLNADAVKYSIDNLVASSLTGPALLNVASTTVTDPMTVVVNTKTPWVAFPVYLTGQLGFVPSPNMLKSSSGNNHPVGTGPFVYKEWVPNDHFTVTKNPNYWRSGYPYLDQVTFKPIVEPKSRDDSLLSGQIDILHSSDTDTIVDLRGNNSVQFTTDANNRIGEPDEDFIMLNTAVAPLDDVRVRRALAYATNKATINSTINNGLTQLSNGPFPPDSPDYAPTGYPQYNPGQARSLVQAVQRDKGPISFELGTTNNTKSLQEVQLLQGMWQNVGISTHIAQVEQTQFILNALEGKFNAYTWRQFDAPDPDINFVWWSIPNANPVGQLALNFARNKDPQIQAALDQGREHTDQSVRAQAYQTVAKRFGVDIPYLWVNKTLWAVAAKRNVMNFSGGTTPDGSPLLPSTNGTVWTTQVWLNH